MNAFQQELKRKRDNYNYDQFIIEKNLQKGIEQGIEQGIEKGKEIGYLKEKRAIAKVLKHRNIALEVIAESSGLTIEEIQSL